MTGRMVADAGGTNTRIALFDPGSGEFRSLTTYQNGDYSGLEDILSHWLGNLEEPRPTTACIAAAAPPSDDRISMINIDWSFSCRELAAAFGFTRLRWLNDFQANAHALPHLTEGDTALLHAGHAPPDAKLATMGPGTGLGGAVLEYVDGRPHASNSEPGHAGLSPATELEMEVFRRLLSSYREVHAELLVCGAGLVRLYRLISDIRGERAEDLSPAQVSRAALDAENQCCVDALNTFCALLGSACGDFVLSNGAYGGLYLAGGIVPRMIPFLKASSFQQRFTEKGAMAGHLRAVPLYVITAPQPGLIGAAHAPL